MKYEEITFRIFVGAAVAMAISMAAILVGIALKIWGVLPV